MDSNLDKYNFIMPWTLPKKEDNPTKFKQVKIPTRESIGTGKLTSDDADSCDTETNNMVAYKGAALGPTEATLESAQITSEGNPIPGSLLEKYSVTQRETLTPIDNQLFNIFQDHLKTALQAGYQYFYVMQDGIGGITNDISHVKRIFKFNPEKHTINAERLYALMKDGYNHFEIQLTIRIPVMPVLLAYKAFDLVRLIFQGINESRYTAEKYKYPGNWKLLKEETIIAEGSITRLGDEITLDGSLLPDFTHEDCLLSDTNYYLEAEL